MYIFLHLKACFVDYFTDFFTFLNLKVRVIAGKFELKESKKN